VPVVMARTRYTAQPERFEVDPIAGSIRSGGRALGMSELQWDVPTRGTVYGVLTNYRGALEDRGAGSAAAVPTAPRAPLLYIKPANTWIAYGDAIPLPDDLGTIEAGAALGIVMAGTACRVATVDALNFVAGYTIVNDLGEPHQREVLPATRQRCRDGFCAIGPWVVPRQSLRSPDNLRLRVLVNGELKAEISTANMMRSVARLIADVSEFVTLRAGDILHSGVPEHAPGVAAGDRVRVEIEGIGALENPIVPERDLMSRNPR
jgi:5-oxopent-3-ene-1,2,5-tricarboxylate decarboxylase / 2-hydroxyhepta-2,4-diene-1,7-dioate isomerase